VSVRAPFEIGGQQVPAGTRVLVDLPVSKLSNHTPVTLPVHVVHGRETGQTMFVSAAVHGDELNGVEIIRRVLRVIDPAVLRGTLLCVPVVNAYGFIGRSRYLPDRRDLNRSFPGSPTGSLAARLAHILLGEVIRRSHFGVDLHTAAIHRVNLPQIRADFAARPGCRALADLFGVQVVLASPERDGSLRAAATRAEVDVLVYEGGEGLRFDEFAIKAGVEGIGRMMAARGMIELPGGDIEPPAKELRRGPVFADSSKWVRAPDGGVFRGSRRIGQAVSEGDLLGWIANPYDDSEMEVRAPVRGIIIGATTLPIVNMGDALFHIAWSREHQRRRQRTSRPVAQATEQATDLAADPVMDEDEII
jgi:predicted deacylase